MSLKKTLVASTPKCAKMVASNPLTDEDLDSILEDSDNLHLKNGRRNIHLVNSSLINESTEEEYETVNKGAKTVTPQNEIEIEPEPIKQKRLSSKKPQSRLTNSSLSNTTLCAKDPSHPISATEAEHKDDLSSTSVSDSVQNGSVIVINNNGDDVSTVVSLTETNQGLLDNSTLNASGIGGNSSETVSVNKTKHIEVSESDNNNEAKESTEVNGIGNVAADSSMPGTFGDSVADEPSKTKSSNNISRNSTQNDVDTDSDTETPKTRRNVSGNSTCPNETFKKKLFNNYEETVAAASVATTSVANTSVPVAANPVSKRPMFDRKCYIRLERSNVCQTPIKQPMGAPDSNGEDSNDDISERNQQHKSSSVSAKSLSKLKPSISKESYLNNWVDTQNSIRENVEVEVVVNRRYFVTSRATQITNSDRKLYFESDEEDYEPEQKSAGRMQSKRSKYARRPIPTSNNSEIIPLRVQPRRGTTVAARRKIVEIDLESVDTVKKTRKNAASKSKVTNEEAGSNVGSTETEATNKKSMAIKNVTKKKAEKDNVEKKQKPEPRKRGRQKKVENLDQETEQLNELSPAPSKANTRKNGRRTVKNDKDEEPSMPSKSTRVTGKKAAASVEDAESDSDSDNVPLMKIVLKTKAATTTKSVVETIDDNPEPETVPGKATRKTTATTGTRKRKARESEAAPAVTVKRVMSRRNAQKPVVIDDVQISNLDSVSTKSDDSDNESKKGAKKRKTKRVTKKK